MVKRTRNYKAEYARRIAAGKRKGLTRSQARGHPKASEKHVAPKKMRSIEDAMLQRAIIELRKGRSLTETARSIHVTPERLRNQITSKAAVEKRGRRWFVREELPRRVLLYSGGKEITLTVTDFKNASITGHYMNAVGMFIRTNNPRYLQSFVGQSVTDISGKDYVLETRPNALYRLNASTTESFEQIYRIVI